MNMPCLAAVCARALARGLCCVAVGGLLMSSAVVLPATALAQRDAGAKARGDFTFYARSGGSHMNAAHAHASHYHGYLGRTETISPRIVRMSGSAINHHIDHTQQHLEGLREHFEATGDKQSLAEIASIEKHIADAKHHHATAESKARTTPDDIASIQESVDELRVSLDKAISAYGALLAKHDLADEPVVTPGEAKAKE
jgi:hypothetical protein